MSETTKLINTLIGIGAIDKKNKSKALSIAGGGSNVAPDVGISDAEVETLRQQGYREGDNVPNRGILRPDGTFSGSTYGANGAVINSPTPNEYDKALQDEIARQKLIAGQSLDENNIRNKVMGQFQAEIDAVNRIYADKLAQERLAGKGREGQTYAIGARHGLLGTDFGAAQVDETQQYNKKLETSITNEQQLAIAKIMGQARQAAIDEIATKRAAIQEGAKSYLNYLSTSTQRKESNVSKLVASLLSQGIDPSTQPDQIKEIAKTLGVTEQDILNQYAIDKKSYDTAQEDRQIKLDKAKADAKQAALMLVKTGVDISKPFNEGGYIWQYNPSTGDIEIAGDARSVNDGSGDITSQELKMFINKQIATPEFKKMTKSQKEDFIRANGGSPEDYVF